MAEDETLCWAAFRVSTWLFSYRMHHVHKSQGTLQSGYFPENNKIIIITIKKNYN